MKSWYCENNFNMRKQLQLLRIFAKRSMLYVWQGSEYICLGFWFWIWEASEYVGGYTAFWVWLNFWTCQNMPKYAWMCLNLPDWFLFYFPIVIPCLLKCLVTYFNVYTQLEVIAWRITRLHFWRDKLWYFL